MTYVLLLLVATGNSYKEPINLKIIEGYIYFIFYGSFNDTISN
jgi:hypothetical protein